MKELQRIFINPANAILTIVDMQNEFCKPGGSYLHEQPERARIMSKVIRSIQKLSERARNAGIPIIYIQSVRTLKEAEFTVYGKKPSLEMGTWSSEIIDELKPHKKDIVVQKFSHSPFLKPEVDKVLHRLVPDPTQCYAIVIGGGLAICLFHAVLGFHLRDYWTVVPVDSVYHTPGPQKRRTLEYFSHPAYPNIFLSRSNYIDISKVSSANRPALIPGT